MATSSALLALSQQPGAGQPGWLAPLQRGAQQQQTERWAEAATSYRAAIAAGLPAQHQMGVASNLGLALQNSGQLDEALSIYDRVLAVLPANGDTHHNRGNALYQAARHEEAMAAFGSAVALVPTDAGSFFNRGNAADKLARHAEAASDFGMALQLEPHDKDAAFNQANALKSLGRAAEAVGLFRRTLHLDGAHPAAYANLGMTLGNQGKHAEAASQLRHALALQPADAAAWTALGDELKSLGEVAAAADAYRSALRLAPDKSEAYTGLGLALKAADPKGAADAFAHAAETDREMRAEAEAVRAWLRGVPAGRARAAAQLEDDARYPEIFERAPRCAVATFAEALRNGSAALAAGGPLRLRGATAGWAANAWDDGVLAGAVGEAPLPMLAMPTETHPTLDAEHDALVEPARTGVFLADFLALTDPAAAAAPFSAYLAQMNLLALPRLLRQVCLSKALPGEQLEMANLWVGGELMKNGLHFDNFDNLLHQIRGRKRALLFPPADTALLHYGEANIRRHEFALAEGGVSNRTHFEKVRRNVAKINVFAPDVAATHPSVARASPTLCELEEGEALFLPRGWHHAVVSASPARRNLAVNLWYDLHADKGAAGERLADLGELFQAEGCSELADSKVLRQKGEL